MRRFAFLLLSLFFVVACTSRQPAAVVPGGRVVMLTDSLLRHGGRDTVRFGRLHSGEVAVSRLWFENGTSQPVVFASVVRSCGCTSLSYDAAPLLPGQTRAVELTFDSRGERGWQFRNLDLFFAGYSQPFRFFAEVDIE